MWKNNLKGVKVGSSHPTPVEELKRNHKELQEMLANGYQLKDVKVKRPRIKKEAQPKQVVVTLGGNWTVKLSFEEYKQRGDGLKIVMKIY